MNTYNSKFGYFFLADISGFTAYLVDVELEHATDILEELLEYIAGQIRPVFIIHDFDPDSVFAYAPASKIERFEILYELIDSTYTGFKNRLTAISRRTTCTCAACRSVTSLDLKFIVDYGEYVLSQVQERQALLGLVPLFVRNRAWKEPVVNSTAWRGYVLFTETCLVNLDLAAKEFQAMEFVSGQTRMCGLDLEAHYQDMIKARRVIVSPDETDGIFSLKLPLSRSAVWEWLNDPVKRNQWWYPGLAQWSAYLRPGGLVGAGAVNHCNHGVGMVAETVLDWQPFEYFTVEMRITPGNLNVVETIRLESVSENQTRLSGFLRFQNKRELAPLMAPLTAQFLKGRMKRIGHLASG